MDLIIIDGTCPLGQLEEHLYGWHRGGVTVATNENFQKLFIDLVSGLRDFKTINLNLYIFKRLMIFMKLNEQIN